jgi:hypothetical protein
MYKSLYRQQPTYTDPADAARSNNPESKKQNSPHLLHVLQHCLFPLSNQINELFPNKASRPHLLHVVQHRLYPAYPVPIPCLSPAYPLPIPCLPPAYPLPIPSQHSKKQLQVFLTS